jgi:hypothetical protein
MLQPTGSGTTQETDLQTAPRREKFVGAIRRRKVETSIVTHTGSRMARCMGLTPNISS